MINRPYFHLVFRPNIRLASTVRRFTNELYQRVLANQELAARVALATHEVLENAIAYAADDEAEIVIDFDGDVVNVRTWNRAAPERIDAIKNGIDEVMTAPDPDAYYQQQMLVTANRTDGSGLGLARIRNEAEMNLSYEIDQDRVCIRAATRIVGGVRA